MYIKSTSYVCLKIFFFAFLLSISYIGTLFTHYYVFWYDFSFWYDFHESVVYRRFILLLLLCIKLRIKIKFSVCVMFPFFYWYSRKENFYMLDLSNYLSWLKYTKEKKIYTYIIKIFELWHWFWWKIVLCVPSLHFS